MHEQTKTWGAPDWIIRGKTRRSGRNKTTTKCGGRRPEAPDWNILGGISSRGHRPTDWSIRGQVAARSPRRVHPGRNKEQGLPPPGRDHPGTNSGQVPRTESFGADRAAGAVAARTGSSRDKGRPDGPDWNIRSRSGSRSQRTHDTKVDGHVAGKRPGRVHPGRIKQQEPPQPGLDHPGTRGGQTPQTGTSGVDQAAGANEPTTQKSTDTWRANAPDGCIRDGSSSRSRRSPDWIIRGQGAARRPRLEHPGWIRQQEPTHPRHESQRTRVGQTPGLEHPGQKNKERPQPPGPGKDGLPPRTGLPGADQPEGVPTPRAGASRGQWRPEAKESRRPRPRWCSEGDKPGSNAKDNAEEMQRGREVDDAEETQGSKDEDGAVVKQRNRPMDKAGVMQRSSCEDKAVVQQGDGGEDKASMR